MAELGQVAIVGALALAVYAIVASLAGVRLGRGDLVLSGRNAAWGVSGLYTAASVALLVAFVVHDFSLRYVYDNSSRAMPLDMLMPAFYSGQRGSLLFWGWTLALFTAAVLWQLRRPGSHSAFMPYVVAVLSCVLAFMAFLLGFVAQPFERLPFTPPDGVGLNPLLYDEGMKIHPPMLLMGYMSWSVPFAFAIAGLATARFDATWLRLSRRYAMVAWLILGLGNLLGAWWAYRVLGWGGFWGWDPVENVAFMPWLTGTAFIHSLQMQERRGMLKSWNLALILVTFFLCIFGTFIVRSGVLASVHSFALSSIGPYFLAYLGVIMAGSLALFFWRLPQMRGENELDSVLSREASFLLNNLLFLGLTFAIFWGTVYPLVAEMLGGGKISVGAPYFNQVTAPIFGALFLLMGIAPLMPWRRASREHLASSFLPPVAAALAGTGLIAALGIRNPAALVGFGLCLFVLATIVSEFWRGTRARHQATGEGIPQALIGLVRRNNRRYGGYLVHLAMILIGAGVIGSQSFQQETHATLQPNQSVTLGNYTLTAQPMQTYVVPGSRTVEAPFLVNGSSEVVRPQKVFFQNFERQPSTKVAIHSTLFEDLYVVLSGWEGAGADQRISVSVYVNPLVGWIWVGGLVFFLGSFIAMWPARQPVPKAATAPSSRGYAGATA